VSFDPAALPPFTVILIPYTFENVTVKKIFIIVCHENGFAFCIKTTSNSEYYKNSPALMAGCVFYKAKEHSCFHEDTYIQPDNQFGIAHSQIADAEKTSALTILGTMPADFKEKLTKAVTSSITMNSRKKARILKAMQA
jgi:hypothetical protein